MSLNRVTQKWRSQEIESLTCHPVPEPGCVHLHYTLLCPKAEMKLDSEDKEQRAKEDLPLQWGRAWSCPPGLGIPVAWGHSLCLMGAAAGPPQGGKSPQRTVCAFEVYKLGLCIALNLFRFFCSSQIFLSYKAQGRHHGLCEAISKLPAFFFFSGPSLPMCK